MNEKNKILFFDTSKLIPTPGIEARCNSNYLQNKLELRFKDEPLKVVLVKVNHSGKYKNKKHGLMMKLFVSSSMEGLPPYCEVKIEHKTGRHTETITVWSPLAWNDRFMGTAGGGIQTGGEGFITKPDNTSRGMTLPKAVINGFTAATTNGALTDGNWALDPHTGKLDLELIENWHAKSTHFMTLIGKAVAEILHQRPVLYSYLHGGSGGGRQSLVEAQEYPLDYNGIWASCPAINWTKFVLCGLWPIAVMNSYGHILSHKKIKYFMEAAQNSVGGKEQFYRSEKTVEFDLHSLIGQKCDGEVITEVDAKVMKEIWDGPKRINEERLWYGFRPGVHFWNIGLPIGAFYYTLFKKRLKPFFLSTYYARWITENPFQEFDNITKEEFEKLFDRSISKFSKISADNVNLMAFKNAGGKLIIDHGIDDPLIPVDGTIDYYNRICNFFDGKDKVESFCKLYITPGDGHGTCSHHGPGITESDGMKALIDWVENGVSPNAIRTVQTKKDGKIIVERTQKPY